MRNEVFITKTAKFLPNNPVDNDHMEDYLGKIGGNPSRVRSIVLRQNGIKQRYYALTTNQQITHTNAEMTANAINNLFDEEVKLTDIELLACGTSSPDQLLPSHTAMVHGLLKEHPVEIISPSGVCLSSAHALKAGYSYMKAGLVKNAVCAGSELSSGVLQSKNYEEEYEKLTEVETKPLIAFEKDFLRFMLSDGAGAFLLEDKPRGDLSLRIDWIESISYASETETCMFMGAEKRPDGELKSWKEFTEQEWLDRSVFGIKQDIRLLDVKIIGFWIRHLKDCFTKHNINPAADADYFIAHFSSMFFHDKLRDAMNENGIAVPYEKWFFNLP
ncbi:MAG: StlD/DarB family beta-ketosynthase, partial [Prevotellaceae bacterium]|nr:StlD/DarB family beta-ketosynthase [Prevotellaceae bacterium]